MMPRSERLRRVRDIENILRRSRRAMHPAMILRVRPNDLKVYRSTVVVSSAVSKEAVVRNRIKRQIRHQLRAVLKNISNQGPFFDIMVTVKKPLLTTSVSDRLQILLDLLFKVGVKKHQK